MADKPLQLLKALIPMLVTVSGTVSEVRLVQPENRLSEMSDSSSGSVSVVRLLQSLKAPSPRLVIPSGSVMPFT